MLNRVFRKVQVLFYRELNHLTFPIKIDEELKVEGIIHEKENRFCKIFITKSNHNRIKEDDFIIASVNDIKVII